VDPADISVRPPVYDVDPAMRCITKHEKSLAGKVHLHHRVADRHCADACWHLSNDGGRASILLLLRRGLGGTLSIYDVINFDAPEKMHRIWSALPMTFKPAFVAAQPFFKPLDGRIDAHIRIGTIPSRLHIETRG